MEFHKITLALLLTVLVACGQEYEFALPPSSDNFGAGATYNNKVDIVFIVDDSESMQYPQQNLLAALPGMVSKLLSSKLDLHIAVTSTSVGGANPSGGRFIGNPKYFTSGTANLGSALTSRLNLGTGGRDREAGIESLFMVMSPNYSNGEAAGFYRDDALLAIIEITNEDDNSGLGSATDYINAIDGVRRPFANGDRSWVFNVIGILDNNPSCATNPGQHYIERADTLIAMTDATKGQKESICSNDYTNAVSNIRARIVQILSDFKLSRVPNLSTVRVYQNGALVPRSNVNGWDYISAGNLIRFYGTWLPAADAKIQVDFTPATAD
jgi:hypothetical protein